MYIFQTNTMKKMPLEREKREKRKERKAQTERMA
jgi:hypothetical protein